MDTLEAMFQPAMTFDDIGEILGVSGKRVQQIYRKAMRKVARVAKRREVRALLADIEAIQHGGRQYALSAAEVDARRCLTAREVEIYDATLRIAEEQRGRD